MTDALPGLNGVLIWRQGLTLGGMLLTSPHGANSQYLTNAHTTGTITKKATLMVPST
jgi:hypothetical protein